MCGDDGLRFGITFGNLVFRGFIEVIGQVHAFHVNILIGRVIELQPVALLAVFVDITVVGTAHLVDTDGGDSLRLLVGVAEGRETSR